MSEDIHVMPTNDLQEHTMSANCHCKPNVEVVGAVLIYTHNAFDHREFVEEIDAWLSSDEVQE